MMNKKRLIFIFVISFACTWMVMRFLGPKHDKLEKRDMEIVQNLLDKKYESQKIGMQQMCRENAYNEALENMKVKK